jgi:hypothetical protein
MIKIEGMILSELATIRDNLYNSLPTGNAEAWLLLKAIKAHIADLDKIIEHYEKVDE